MFLLDTLLLSPIYGVIWVGKKVNEMVEEEISSEGRIKEKLMELQLRFELDEISEGEYQQKEEELLQQLDTIKKAKGKGV